MLERRSANTVYVQFIWSAINNVKDKKATVEKIYKNLVKDVPSMTQNECNEELQQAEAEGLLAISNNSDACNVPYYANIPITDNPQKDTHDWYCFECHQGGSVALCTTCWRVYHRPCIPLTNSEFNVNNFVCFICKKQTSDENNISKKVLKSIFSFLIKDLKSLGRELCKLKCDSEVDERIKFIIYKDMDLDNVETKIQNNTYKSIIDFSADIYLVAHNVVIIWGNDSSVSDSVNKMIVQMEESISLALSCTNCYINSKTISQDWFCKPCTPRHELVFAKVRGHPYWPAKIMRHIDTSIEVKFFGEPHERSLVKNNNIKAINTDKRVLNLKKSASLDKALEQLEKHIKLCKGKPISHTVNENVDNEICSSEDDSEKQIISKPQGTVHPIPRKRFRSSQEQKVSPAINTNCGCGKDILLNEKIKEIEELKAQFQIEKAAYIAQLTNKNKIIEDDNKTRQRYYEEQLSKDLEVINEKHKEEISKTKQKQWCSNCESEAIYHCCWNTSYCSSTCQSNHWPNHRRTCRRKR